MLPVALHGLFQDGYDDSLVNRVLGEIHESSGRTIVCLWSYVDTIGFGGDSDLHVVVAGRLHELAGDLWRWLNDDPEDPATPSSPGAPESWVGAPTRWTTTALPHHDGSHNYARTTT